MLLMSYVLRRSGVAVAMMTNRRGEVVEYACWCLLLIKFVKCHGECGSCSVDYLRSRLSVAGGC